jgi:hypothetical protein
VIRSNTLLVPIERADPKAPQIAESVLRALLRGHQRCFIPSVREVDFEVRMPGEGRVLSVEAVEALARRAAYTRVLLQWVATSKPAALTAGGLEKWMAHADNKAAANVHAKFPNLTFAERGQFIVGGFAALREDMHASAIPTPGLDAATRRALLWPMPECARQVIERFMNRDLPGTQPWAVLLEVLGKDDSLTMLLRASTATALRTWLGGGAAKNAYPSAVGEIVPSLHDALIGSFVGPAVARVLDPNVKVLVEYLLDRVDAIRAAELPAVPAVLDGIEGTCNPARDGISYRFTRHGRRVRRARDFGDKESAASGNARRLPVTEDPTRVWKCGKLFPEVSAKAMTYLFVAVCMIHQTVHGFHMIPGAEGQKDGHAAMYGFSPNPPSEYCFDNACGQHEFNSNRESGYFSDTPVYHDAFHGWKHTCSRLFRLARIRSFRAWNSSLMEQFNAFIKKRVRSSAPQMSQVNFMFYMSFYVMRWNEEKIAKSARILRVQARARA